MMSALEKKGLRNAGLTALSYIVLLVVVLMIPGSPLRNEDGGLVPSPLLKGIVPVLLFFFGAVAVAYGITVKKITGFSEQKPIAFKRGVSVRSTTERHINEALCGISSS